MLIYGPVGLFLCGLLYFLFIVMDLAVLLSPAVGLLAYVFWRIVTVGETPKRSGWAILGVSAGGSALGLITARLLGLPGGGWWDAAGVLLAGFAGLAIHSLLAESARPCQLCGSEARGASFTCPRCQDVVCSRPTCWNARYSRCTRCHEREVPILPIHEQWWVARVGRRAHRGECTHCYKEAHEADLRECGRCHWPLCRRCWDYLNGTCPRCEWVMPDLPPALAALTAARPRQSARAGSSGSAPRLESAAPPAQAPDQPVVEEPPRVERPAHPRRVPRR